MLLLHLKGVTEKESYLVKQSGVKVKPIVTRSKILFSASSLLNVYTLSCKMFDELSTSSVINHSDNTRFGFTTLNN